VRDVLEPATWRILSPALLTALGGGSEVVEFDGPGGTRFEATCTPVVDDGAVIGATAVARDLAVEQGERATLGALLGEFDAVFEHSPVGQGLLSIEGRWIRVNARLCELLGATPGELLGEDASAWLHPEGRAWHVERYRELLSGLDPTGRATFRVLGARGHESAVRAHVAVLRTPDGWPRGAIVQIVRVTDA
jgi:PAS domain S-box-containing protein